MDSSIEAERAHQPLPHDSGQLRGIEIALDAGIDERVTATTAVLVCSVVTVGPAWTGMSATLWLSAQTRTVAKRGGLPTVYQAAFAVSFGSKAERLFSMAQATPRSRSATDRRARACPCPRNLRAVYLALHMGSC